MQRSLLWLLICTVGFALPMRARADARADTLLRHVAERLTAVKTLSEALKGHRATFLDFWFWRCSPCQEELPHLQALYDELKAQGLNVLTVNVEDTPDTLRPRLQEKRFTLPVAFDRHSDDAFNLRYGVQACPTHFILDEKGTVVFRMTTFGEKTLRRILRRMGIH
jgi:thiol-disulfide isomerase/thioredoxin